mmetsp:Transcript_52761/g.145865  ORF Transcript_52761/g.145865 Transcript_52761/m.145865 type:complete len:325 (-) Transcript_52761:276-1250(-)
MRTMQTCRCDPTHTCGRKSPHRIPPPRDSSCLAMSPYLSALSRTDGHLRHRRVQQKQQQDNARWGGVRVRILLSAVCVAARRSLAIPVPQHLVALRVIPHEAFPLPPHDFRSAAVGQAQLSQQRPVAAEVERGRPPEPQAGRSGLRHSEANVHHQAAVGGPAVREQRRARRQGREEGALHERVGSLHLAQRLASGAEPSRPLAGGSAPRVGVPVAAGREATRSPDIVLAPAAVRASDALGLHAEARQRGDRLVAERLGRALEPREDAFVRPRRMRAGGGRRGDHRQILGGVLPLATPWPRAVVHTASEQRKAARPEPRSDRATP